MFIQRIQIEAFRGGSDLVIDGLRNGFNAILMPDWTSASELQRQVLESMLGLEDPEESGQQAVFFVSDDMGEAIVTSAEFRQILSDEDLALLESLFHDEVQPSDLPELLDDLDLTKLFIHDDSNPNPAETVRLKIDARNEILQEAIAKAGRQCKQRTSRPRPERTEYARLVNQRSELAAKIASLKETTTSLANEIAPLQFAAELAGDWEKLNLNKKPSKRSLEKLVRLQKDIDSLDKRLRKIDATSARPLTTEEVADAKRKLKLIKNLIRESELLPTDADSAVDSAANATSGSAVFEADETVGLVATNDDSKVVSNTEDALLLDSKHLVILDEFAQQLVQAQAQLRHCQRQLAEADREIEVVRPETRSQENDAELLELRRELCFLNDALADLRAHRRGRRLAFVFVFVAGLIVTTWAAVLRQGDAQWGWIGLGMLVMFSAVFVRNSFERIMKKQQFGLCNDIAQALTRLERIEQRTEDSKPKGSEESELRDAEESVDVARRNWHEALRVRNLDPTILATDWLERRVDLFLPMRTERPLNVTAFSSHLTPDAEAADSPTALWKSRATELLGRRTADVVSLSLADIVAMLNHEQHELSAALTAARESEQSRKMQLKEVKRKRKELLETSGVATAAELKRRIETERAKHRHDQEHQQELARTIEERLASSPFGDQARSYLEANSRDALLGLLQARQQQLQQMQNDQQRLESELQQISQRLDDMVKSRDSELARLAQFEASEKLRRATSGIVSNLIVQDLLDSRAAMPPIESGNEVLRSASRTFRDLTERREAKLVFDADTGRFFVDEIGQPRRSLEDLNEEESLCATISIQMALFAYLRETGVNLPLVITDRWIAEQNRFAKRLLEIFAQLEGEQQIVMISWHPDQQKFLNQCSFPVLVVDCEESEFYSAANGEVDSIRYAAGESSESFSLSADHDVS